MSKFGFLAQMGITKMGKIGDAITVALVNFDPETASEAEIEQFRHKSNDIAARVARAESDVAAANKTVVELNARLERDRTAAIALRTKLGTLTDAAQITATQTAAGTIVAQMKEIGGENMKGDEFGTLFDAKKDLADAQADLSDWTQVHQQAVAQLTQAQNALKNAAHDMERARQQQAKALEKQHMAEADANLRSGLGSSGNGIAIDAMTHAANDARQKARAAELQAEALKGAKGTDVDSLVAATLKEATPKASVMDDLNNL